MVWAAAIHWARAVRLHVASHGSNNNKVLCTSAQHFNIASHNGDNDKASCTSAQHLYVASYNGNNNKALCASACYFQRCVARRQQGQQETAATTPYVNYEPNHAQAVSYRVSRNGEDNNKNGDNAIVFHIASCDGNDNNNELRHQT
jgi:hypothetical protein